MKHFEQAFLSKIGLQGVQADAENTPGGEIHCSSPIEDGHYHLQFKVGPEFDVEVRNQHWLDGDWDKQ